MVLGQTAVLTQRYAAWLERLCEQQENPGFQLQAMHRFLHRTGITVCTNITIIPESSSCDWTISIILNTWEDLLMTDTPGLSTHNKVSLVCKLVADVNLSVQMHLLSMYCPICPICKKSWLTFEFHSQLVTYCCFWDDRLACQYLMSEWQNVCQNNRSLIITRVRTCAYYCMYYYYHHLFIPLFH